MPASQTKALNLLYTAISRKVVGKTLHATIPKGNMRNTVHDTVAVACVAGVERGLFAPATQANVAVEPTFVAFL